MRIVQLANFVSPTSGGIRTTIRRLAAGYLARGHEPVLIVPGPEHGVHETDEGLVVTVRAPKVPGTGGYRMITDLDAVRDALDDLGPDRLEVHDRFTLRAAARWGHQRDVPAMAVVHERLDRLAGLHVPWLLRPGVAARWDNARLARLFHTVVVPSRWAAEEFHAADARNVQVVGWGVDLEQFHPSARSSVLRRRLLQGASLLVVTVVRLSPEKRPDSVVNALRVLRDRGVDARLVVAGTGAIAGRVQQMAQGLPATFLGHLEGRDHVAELLAAGDVTICPGPVETFGLAALESLACGTPVVSSVSGAIAELMAEPHGIPAWNTGPSMASGVQRLVELGRPARAAARAEAERHPWDRAVDRMLDLHERGDGTAASDSASARPRSSTDADAPSSRGRRAG